MEIKGLTEEQAKENQLKYGWNEFQKKKKTLFIFKIFKKLFNPLILILLFSSILSAFLGEKVDSLIIVIILFISLFLDVYQERQAENAAEELEKKIIPQSTVIRNGKERKVPTREVTVGDIVVISAGNIIPADAKVIESDSLNIDEAALTGESFPKEKNSGDSLMMGSHVVSGFGKASVITIGGDTEFGKIHQSVSKQKPVTEFQKGLNNFSFLLVRTTIILGLALFVSNIWLGHDLILSLMFVLALTIGFAPELLPMILTINLSKGALKLAKGGVIVKFLPSIENLGSMDTLCTDKTGTLTEGSIALESAVDKDGAQDGEVLNYACLNSYFQSGYKNPMDDAILKKAGNFDSDYKKIDEIAYDFYRRRLSVILQKDGQTIMVTKGSVQSVLAQCLNKEEIKIDFEKINRAGLRTLGIAIKKVEDKKSYEVGDENDLIFIGALTFSDTLKKDIGKMVDKLSGSGVNLKIVTGDNELVAESICEKIGVLKPRILIQEEIEKMPEEKLLEVIDEISIFARINPETKLRIISALRKRGHVVGYLGDGINDASALKCADVGISVSNAVDVARESADLILLKKDLEILQTGIEEGRKTFANIMKYIFMGTSSTFGNMISLSLAAVILPFLPMLPVQVLLNDLLYDFSQILLVKDNVDPHLVQNPYRWNVGFIKKFMLVFGSASSVFDMVTFFILYKVLRASSGMFQTGWFLESALSQMFIIFSIRTTIVPFYKSKANSLFTLGILAIIGFVLFLPFSLFAAYLHLVKLPPIFFLLLVLIISAYVILTEILKYFFYRKIRPERISARS